MLLLIIASEELMDHISIAWNVTSSKRKKYLANLSKHNHYKIAY